MKFLLAPETITGNNLTQILPEKRLWPLNLTK